MTCCDRFIVVVAATATVLTSFFARKAVVAIRLCDYDWGCLRALKCISLNRKITLLYDVIIRMLHEHRICAGEFFSKQSFDL